MVESSKVYNQARALSFGARGTGVLSAGGSGTRVAHPAIDLDKMD